MKNRLIIFDCFGVIFEEIAPPFFRKHFEEETAAILKEKYFVPADLGEITRDELFNRMSEELGIEKSTILKEWDELTRFRPYMAPIIEKLGKTADIALLSNAPLGFVEEIFEKNNLTRLFDKMFISANLKMAKPDPAFYLHCVNSFGKKYDEIFMIDDSPKNLEHLIEIGITPILFTDAEAMLSSLGEC
ncbi:MAG: HAD-IA family hydrolase [Clostridia bacterium]|nr:HAD-IA family hydrolase [Clostridia bacterium]